MLKIYHVPGTRSIRPIWLCAELGLAHEVITIDFSAEYRAGAEWRALNPVGKVPVMEDGDLILFESGAMVQYLLDRYGEGRLQPAAGTPEHAVFLQWCWFAESTLARPLGEIVNHRREFPGSESPDAIQEMKNRAHLCVQALDQTLSKRPYLLGERFSAADIMTGYSLYLWEKLAPCDGYPNAAEYWQRLQQRPACQAALNA